MTVTGSSVGIQFRQKFKEEAEPLLRFPFIHSLANPCDFQSDVFHLQELDASLRDLTRNGDIPLADQVMDFLIPFRHLIQLTSAGSTSSNDTKEQSAQEFKLVVSQALHLSRSFYSPSVS